MSQLEDAISEIKDPKVRERVNKAVSELKQARRYGLVFENHFASEMVVLPGLPIRVGSAVTLRSEPANGVRYFEVVRLDGEDASLVPAGGGEERSAPKADLLVVKPFEEPIYPGLTPVGGVARGGPDKPAHMVWNAENFHALQLLLFTHVGKVDVIYIDPPYNTGARDWKYNNRFVDDNDTWRHSKWLSMMEKRLKLASKLLKPDGVLIVTIDEHEVHRLGVLLDQLFPSSSQQMVTTVTNHAGVSQGAFARVEEYAFFVFAGAAETDLLERDLMTQARSSGARQPTYWYSLVRSGTGSDPADRPTMVYPVFVDNETGRIVGTGETLTAVLGKGASIPEVNEWMPDLAERTSEGYRRAWPIRTDGRMGRWRIGRDTLERYIEHGYTRAGRFDQRRGTTSITYLKTGTIKRIESGDLALDGRDPVTGVVNIISDKKRETFRPKTVWVDRAHDAGKQGSVILKTLLGRKAFDFPKSPYLVADSIAAVASSNKDAVILDFFAGSGTTLHATAMLNARDGGNRKCILVTNNELPEADAKALMKVGRYRGDPDFEAAGIFESVTKPRVEAALTGVRPDGKPAKGSYLPQYLEDHSYADGFEENVEFFRVDYLDPDVVSLGRQYDAIAPLLWAASGSIGEWESRDGDEPWSAPKTSTYAILFEEDSFVQFEAHLKDRPEITHAWLVTNSALSFADMRAELSGELTVGMLYADYLRNFEINTVEALR